MTPGLPHLAATLALLPLAIAQSGHEVDVQLPAAPIPFLANGKTHLVYELRIANSTSADLHLKQIDVSGDSPLATFDSGALKRILKSDRIVSGAAGVAFLWITLPDSTAVPARLYHKLVFDNRIVEAETAVDTSPLPVLGPPLHGEGWFSANGPANGSEHRRASISTDGRAKIAQRFAIDWVKIGDNGDTHKGGAKDNRNYYAYGAEALAVADATVVTTKDGIPQNVPGENSRALEITRETIGGNHIILDLGNGRFAFYAHLQPGSLRVKVGDHVKRGQALALVGNSGNSDEPHLHFHVSDRNSMLDAEGVPYLLESFEVRRKDKQYEKHERELPLASELIRFP
jgi:hypothetical protein